MHDFVNKKVKTAVLIGCGRMGHRHFEVLNKLLTDEIFSMQISQICNLIKVTFKEKGKVIFAGNGGSFADAQHLTAEFICRFKNTRTPLPAITLGTN